MPRLPQPSLNPKGTCGQTCLIMMVRRLHQGSPKDHNDHMRLEDRAKEAKAMEKAEDYGSTGTVMWFASAQGEYVKTSYMDDASARIANTTTTPTARSSCVDFVDMASDVAFRTGNRMGSWRQIGVMGFNGTQMS